MEKDPRIVEREKQLAIEGVISGKIKVDYRDILIAGGATPRDMAYLDAYHALCEENPKLAQVIVEAYFFVGFDKDRYDELIRQKGEAVAEMDFEKAARIRDQADAVKAKHRSLPKLLEELAQRLASISKGFEGLETVDGVIG